VRDFVFGLVRLYEDGVNRQTVKIQILHTQGDKFTDSKSCIEHQQGHAVVADRLAGFGWSVRIVFENIEQFFAFVIIKGGR